jgi:hypothetical protein
MKYNLRVRYKLVSEVGWKKKTLQLIIRHFNELRNDMCAGQEERAL